MEQTVLEYRSGKGGPQSAWAGDCELTPDGIPLAPSLPLFQVPRTRLRVIESRTLAIFLLDLLLHLHDSTHKGSHTLVLRDFESSFFESPFFIESSEKFLDPRADRFCLSFRRSLCRALFLLFCYGTFPLFGNVPSDFLSFEQHFWAISARLFSQSLRFFLCFPRWL